MYSPTQSRSMINLDPETSSTSKLMSLSKLDDQMLNKRSNKNLQLASAREPEYYPDNLKKHVVKNRHVLNRSKTESEFILTPRTESDTASLNPSSSLSKLKLTSLTDINEPCLLSLPLKKNSMTDSRIILNKFKGKIQTGSTTSLEPLSRSLTIHSDALSDSLRKLNSESPEKKKNNSRRSRSKKKVSSPLSVIDYSNIINLNTSHQMLVNFLENSRQENSDLSLKKNQRNNKSCSGVQSPSKSHKPQFHMFLNNYIQKQATLSEQMASLFGSSMCTCCLCCMKTIDSKRILQHNYELTPEKANTVDYTIKKYTYSNPISELSTLKLFNLINTDCSIFFNEANPTEQSKETSKRSTISNNTVLLPFGSTDNLPINNSIKVNNNSPPIYDSRYLYLIDCRRNKKEFEKSRIHTAIHYSDLLNDSVYLSQPFENFTLIVLYDEDGTNLTSSFNKVKNPKLIEETVNPQYQSDYLIDKIRAKLNCSESKTMYVLSGGYKEFNLKFPFMSSSLNIRSTVDRNKYLTIYPNCVIENQIYIGSAIQAKNWKIIRELKITHIINATFEHECVFKDEVKYLHMEVEDSHDEKINKTFVTALEFMRNAFDEYQENLRGHQATDGKPLKPPIFLIHCNLGISRSSSILIAYLICKYRLCLYAAFKYLKDKRLQIAPNYSFLRQLKQFEENLG